MAAKLSDISVMVRRQRVHELKDKGFSLEDISARVELSKRGVQRYLQLPKPNVVKPKATHGWQDEAACVGRPLQWFFSDSDSRGLRGQSDRQKGFAVCASCPVTKQCHDNAVANLEQNGVWAGRDFSRVQYVHDPVSGVVTPIWGCDGAVAEVS